jgi:hypothetical protein
VRRDLTKQRRKEAANKQEIECHDCGPRGGEQRGQNHSSFRSRLQNSMRHSDTNGKIVFGLRPLCLRHPLLDIEDNLKSDDQIIETRWSIVGLTTDAYRRHLSVLYVAD